MYTQLGFTIKTNKKFPEEPHSINIIYKEPVECAGSNPSLSLAVCSLCFLTCACVSFLQVFWFPPKNMYVCLIGDFELLLEVSDHIMHGRMANLHASHK